ncbi:MAG: 16S rRNA (uracil(1498)-N(3))-methyltransferase [Planctomycetaceae bacterium]|nr:16S rRNA (uracil(1498)-N(3))-methyltransferase [Planctomycetaceae bacterium]
MTDRFFCPEIPTTGRAHLDGTEAHHLQRVLRKSVGDQIEIFDGSGRAATAEITDLSKRSVTLNILQMRETPKPTSQVTLATAVPKGDRFRWLVEKAVELNVDCLVPMITERSVVKPGEGKREKMEQVVVEACKQSGRNWLMTIEETQNWSDFLNHWFADHPFDLAFIAHPSGPPMAEVLSMGLRGSVLFLVGPEGGWTETEVAQACDAGATAVGLGPNILRIETAAIALATLGALHRLQAPPKNTLTESG